MIKDSNEVANEPKATVHTSSEILVARRERGVSMLHNVVNIMCLGLACLVRSNDASTFDGNYIFIESHQTECISQNPNRMKIMFYAMTFINLLLQTTKSNKKLSQLVLCGSFVITVNLACKCFCLSNAICKGPNHINYVC